jgi:hypothetical protein
MFAAQLEPSTSRRVRGFHDQARYFCQAYSCDRPLDSLAADMIKLRQAIDLLELKFSEMAAELDETDAYQHWGSATAIDWIRHECKMGGGAAADRVDVGRCQEKMPRSQEALAAGEIGFGHLALIARTATALSNSPTSRGFDETDLLEQAKDCSVGRFRHVCHHARHAQDAEGYARRRGPSRRAAQPLYEGTGGRHRHPQRHPRSRRRGAPADCAGAAGEALRQ